MPTRNVVLTAYHEALIESLVTSGRYQNASEVLRAGLRELERQSAEYEAKLAALKGALQVGIDDAEAGKFTVLDGQDAIRAYVQGIADEVLGREPV